MPRIIGKLTSTRVRTAKPKRGRRALVLADGGNLYLQATLGDDGNIRRSWTFRYALYGKRREMGLGPTHTIGLASARARARALREKLVDDIDPLEAREADRRAKIAEAAKTMTFRQCAEAYINLHADGWSAKHDHQWRSSLSRHVYPKIGAMAVRDVDQAAVMGVVEPLWKTKTVTASRVRGRIESILDYATANQFRAGDNPARIGSALPKKAKITKVKHFAAVPWKEIPDFMRELRDIKDDTRARALEFTVLTAARTDQTLRATWGEIDLKAKTWSIPSDRMKKNELEHRVPLSARALAILDSLPKGSPDSYIFGGAKPLIETAMRRQVLHRLRPGLTVHGLRASFKTWAGEATAFPRDVIEKALSHKVGSAVEQAYDRGDLFEKRRRLMSAWADYCAKPVPTTDATVTRIRERERA
jgi:integrase